jgi:hypothetical protein
MERNGMERDAHLSGSGLFIMSFDDEFQQLCLLRRKIKIGVLGRTKFPKNRYHP